MTTQIAVTAKNDIFTDAHGNLGLVYDIDAVLQAAQQAAQSQLGEMQYAIDRGIPNFAVLWGGAPSIAQFEAALRRELLLVTDVIGVPEISVTLAGDAVVYTATIQTVFGNGAING